MTTTHKIWALTTSRADFGIYQSVFNAIAQQPKLELGLVVTGSHLSDDFGGTFDEVKASGWPIGHTFECLDASDTAEGIGYSMSRATAGMASALSAEQPDLLLVLGDRYEMLAAALAAVPVQTPIAHIHGGEETEGAMDNVFRHALTKISQIHFCATPLAAQRIEQMGESPERVFQTGAPSIDSILSAPRLSAAALTPKLGIDATEPFLLVTYHPATLDLDTSFRELDDMLSALDACDLNIVFTGTNADTAGKQMNEKISTFVANSNRMAMKHHLGAEAYYSAMSHAVAMVGNSSSGIIEAASFHLPVINIGNRQKGRERSENTIDVPGDRQKILSAIQTSQSEAFRSRLRTSENVYGNGTAGQQIAETLVSMLDFGIPVEKKFHLIKTGGEQ